MEAEGPLLLTDLPLPLLEHVLLLLDKRTICALAACSLRLHRIARDDGLWRRLCERSFPHTDARRWLNTREELFRRRSADGLLPPDSFRSVYAHLSLYAQLIGAWRWTERRGEGVERLFQFAWEPDGVSCGLVDFSRAAPVRTVNAALRLGSAPGCYTALHLVDSTHAILHEFCAADFSRAPSPAAHAATAVAVVGSPVVLGSSPPGTFGYEMLRFMQTTVGTGRRRRRSSRGSPHSPGGRPAPLRVHHLTRVPMPAPTRAHPLAGLWRADFGVPAGQNDGDGGGGEPSIGVQVLAATYDFSGAAARLVAVKVLSAVWMARQVAGDNRMPAGKPAWAVLASARVVGPDRTSCHIGCMTLVPGRSRVCHVECVSSDCLVLRWAAAAGEPGRAVTHTRIDAGLLQRPAATRRASSGSRI